MLRAMKVVMVVVLASALGACGSSDEDGGSAKAGDSAVAMEAALAEASVLDFPALANSSGHACESAGERDGVAVFSCVWSTESGDEASGDWVLRDGVLSRVSDGGQASAPPGAPAEAAARVSAVVEERAGGSASCHEVAELEFSCAYYEKAGAHVVVNGQPVRGLWEWNDDGTVAQEVIDPEPRDASLDEDAGTPSAPTGADASADCGDVDITPGSGESFMDVQVIGMECFTAKQTLRDWAQAQYEPQDGPAGFSCKSTPVGPSYESNCVSIAGDQEMRFISPP